ncbi:MAG: rod shape-determining protein [Acidobacteria bacterium]|nr:rod shape-determining protein [Acidobacteriota bacterium]
MIWKQIERLFVRGLAIDLGTVNTLIYSQGHGVVLNEPTAIAVNRFNGNVIAAGREALTIMGREPRDVVVHRPIENGVVTDYNLAEQMLRLFLRCAGQNRMASRRFYHMIVGAPNSATHLERRGIQDSALRAGAARVSLVEEGVAAAIGAGVLFQDSRARLVVDIGGGTTNISIVSSVGAIASHSVGVAGLAMDWAIREYIRQEYRILIGEQSAEAVKIQLGSALPNSENCSMRTIGKSLIDNAPHELEIYSDEIFHALDRPIRAIIESVRLVMGEVPPETSADLFATGIVLAGGGSLLRGLEERFRNEIALPVTRAERPLEAVVLGAGYLLDHPSLIDRFQISDEIPSWSLETEIDYTLAMQEVESA